MSRTPHLRVARFVLATLAALSLASCSNTEGPSGPGVASLSVVTGASQSGQAGTPLPVALRVRALAKDSSAMPGIAIRFAVITGGGSVAPDSVLTDAAGIATTVWTLGTAGGNQSVEAQVVGDTKVVADFFAVSQAITGLAIVAGNGQTGYASSGLDTAVVVRVTDQNSNGLGGVWVHFSVTAGGGSLTPDSMLSDASGYAYSFWILGSTLGTQTVRATVNRSGQSALTADFSATALATQRPAGTLQTPLSVGSRPFGLAVSASDAVYVTRLDSAAITRTSAQTMAFVNVFGVGNTPTAVAFDSAGTRAYVANQFGNSIGVVDVSADSQIAAPVVGENTFNVAIPPGGARVYVSGNAGKIYLLNPSTNTVVDSIAPPGAGAMSTMVFAAGGTRLYVGDVNLGAVYEIDPATKQVLRTFNIGGVPQGMAISPDGAFLYIADGTGRLDRWDLTSGASAGYVPLSNAAFALALTKDGTQLYVGTLDGHVIVLDRILGSVVHTITTGGTPRRIGFSHDGLTAVVANEAGWVDFIK